MQVCERLIGKPEIIGLILGVDPKTPYPWRNASSLREAGDLPFTAYQRRLLTHARARQIPLTADHLIWGAPEAEIDALVAAMQPRVEAAE
ncbi:MAG: hypothetical protein V4712_17610 [Pseudomonadota bacterium]